MTDKIDVAALRERIARAIAGELSDRPDAEEAWPSYVHIADAILRLPALLEAAEAKAGLEGENARLREALGLALDYLVQNEPGDSRAVSDEFVAMAAVATGLGNAESDRIIVSARAALSERPQ